MALAGNKVILLLVLAIVWQAQETFARCKCKAKYQATPEPITEPSVDGTSSYPYFGSFPTRFTFLIPSIGITDTTEKSVMTTAFKEETTPTFTQDFSNGPTASSWEPSSSPVVIVEPTEPSSPSTEPYSTSEPDEASTSALEEGSTSSEDEVSTSAPASTSAVYEASTSAADEASTYVSAEASTSAGDEGSISALGEATTSAPDEISTSAVDDSSTYSTTPAETSTSAADETSMSTDDEVSTSAPPSISTMENGNGILTSEPLELLSSSPGPTTTNDIEMSSTEIRLVSSTPPPPDTSAQDVLTSLDTSTFDVDSSTARVPNTLEQDDLVMDTTASNAISSTAPEMATSAPDVSTAGNSSPEASSTAGTAESTSLAETLVKATTEHDDDHSCIITEDSCQIIEPFPVSVSYPPGIKTEWLFRSTVASRCFRFTVTFTRFDVEKAKGCKQDSVQVFSGTESSSHHVAYSRKLCGSLGDVEGDLGGTSTVDLVNIHGTDNKIVLVSDGDANVGGGFRAEVCCTRLE